MKTTPRSSPLSDALLVESAFLPDAENALFFSVGADDGGLRLDAFLSRETGLSRNKVKKYIEDGLCILDGGLCPHAAARLAPGSRLEFFPPNPANALAPEEGALTVLYRDAWLAVVDKPAGLTVHPCPSCPDGTLVHRLLAHFPELARQEGPRPGIVHRIDKDTSGLLIAALDESVRLALAEAFAARQVHKTYLALTRGVPSSTGSAAFPLGRHPTLKTRMAVVPENKGGKPALTEWEILLADPDGRFALAAVTIHTGRTHQIRVHMAQCGHPLWGDKLYAPHDTDDPAARQMLHAWKLAFTHPATGEELSFVCPPPSDFMEAALALSRHTQRVVLTGTPGCGKSSVLRALQDRGIPVWSADAAVQDLYEPDGDGWLMLRGRYGERFAPRRDDGSDAPVDKTALALAFATEPGLRSEVEHLVHPLVYASLENFFANAGAAARGKNAASELAVAEVPLWYESRPGACVEKRTRPSDRRLGNPADPVVVTVSCPAEERRRRLAEIRGWSAEKIAAVESWQWPEEAKCKASRFTLDNGGDENALTAQVDSLLESLAALRREEQTALRERLQNLWGGEAFVSHRDLSCV